MGKKEDLLGAFSKQIDKGTPNNPKVTESPKIALPNQQSTDKISNQKKSTSTTISKERAKTKPISFYDTDLKIIREIQEIIEEMTNERINDSSSVRLALRSLRVNRDKLVKSYLSSKKSDGRRKQIE